MVVRRKTVRNQGDTRMELIRKGIHIFTGVIGVLLFQAGILNLGILGLLILVYAAVVLLNLKYEKEFLMRILSLNRPDAKLPGIEFLAYAVGAFLVLWLFPQEIAFAAIMVLAFGDPLAHLVSHGFGGTSAAVTKNSYIYGAAAGTVAGTLAAWLPGFAGFLPAFIASGAAMFVEAGELRIAEHHVDDNLTIPLVAGTVLWVISYVF